MPAMRESAKRRRQSTDFASNGDEEAIMTQKKQPKLDHNGVKSSHLKTLRLDTSHQLLSLYSATVDAKIWATAQKGLNQPSPPTLFPEFTKSGFNKYVYRDLEFWTSGFFPGSLYLLLERRRKYSHVLARQEKGQKLPHELQLEFACQWWTSSLHQNAYLSTTHDLGFMISPWARRAWELNHDARALQTLITAAKTLATRFNPTVGCIRSWDTCVTQSYTFSDPSADFLVIIDNMMNLSLLFFAAAHTGDRSLHALALAHARKTRETHIRADSSTLHVAVFDPASGKLKQRLTNQGFAHGSCWARGQAWAIAGFAETYHWTGEEAFLDTARGCADYFLAHLPQSKVPPWDFDAPGTADEEPPDTSAAMIAVYGMLLIHESLAAKGKGSSYLAAALEVVEAVCKGYVKGEARIEVAPGKEVETVERGNVRLETMVVKIDEENGGGETIVDGATINNYQFAPRRWANHGLVYADYFFLLVGNKLLDMGVGQLIISS